MGRAVLLIVLLASTAHAAPDGAEGGVPTPLWLHDLAGAGFVNPMPQAFDIPLSEGVVTASLCYPTPLGTLTSQQRHTWAYHSLGGALGYDEERVLPYGQTWLPAALVLDASGMHVTYFLRTATLGHDVPLVVPRVVLSAALVMTENIHAPGDVLASAQTESAELSPVLQGHPHVEHMMDGEMHVYAFRLHVPFADITVPEREAFQIRIQAIVEAPCLEGSIMPPLVARHNRDGFRPHVTVGIVDPVRIVWMLPHMVGEEVAVTAVVASPFGSADAVMTVRPMMVMQTAAGTLVPSDRQSVEGTGGAYGTDRLLVDQHHQADIRIDSSWAHPGQGLHQVMLRVQNQAGTYNATAYATFEIGRDTVGCGHAEDGPACLELASRPVQQSPIPLAFVLIALALVASAKPSR